MLALPANVSALDPRLPHLDGDPSHRALLNTGRLMGPVHRRTGSARGGFESLLSLGGVGRGRPSPAGARLLIFGQYLALASDLPNNLPMGKKLGSLTRPPNN